MPHDPHCIRELDDHCVNCSPNCRNCDDHVAEELRREDEEKLRKEMTE